ncbi:hypothetical protein PMAYCL1PPCAC_20951, partial [Pristionchus mayeri]
LAFLPLSAALQCYEGIVEKENNQIISDSKKVSYCDKECVYKENDEDRNGNKYVKIEYECILYNEQFIDWHRYVDKILESGGKMRLIKVTLATCTVDLCNDSKETVEATFKAAEDSVKHKCYSSKDGTTDFIESSFKRKVPCTSEYCITVEGARG